MSGPHLVSRQNKILKNLGLSSKQIKDFRSQRVFEVDPLEYQRLTTRPKIPKHYIGEDSYISRPNSKGHLEDVYVDKIEGDQLHISFLNRSGKKIKEIIDINQAHYPISGAGSFLLMGKDEIPKLAQSFFGEEISKKEGVLEPIAPRKSPQILKEKNYSLLSPDSGKELSLKIRDLRILYEKKGANKEFIRLNNKMIRELRDKMHQQGISTTAQHLGKGDPRILSLVINGVEENGNKVAKLYKKLADQLDARNLTISLYDNFESGDGGFNLNVLLRTEIGYHTAIDMLKGEKNYIALHELRHQQFNVNRQAGRSSVFDTEFKSGESQLDIYGKKIESPLYFERPYASRLDFEEVYTHSSDAINHLKLLTKELPPSSSIIASKVSKKIIWSIFQSVFMVRHLSAVPSNIKKALPSELELIIDLGPKGTNTTRILLFDDFEREITLPISKKNLDQLENIMSNQMSSNNFYNKLLNEDFTKFKERFFKKNKDSDISEESFNILSDYHRSGKGLRDAPVTFDEARVFSDYMDDLWDKSLWGKRYKKAKKDYDHFLETTVQKEAESTLEDIVNFSNEVHKQSTKILKLILKSQIDFNLFNLKRSPKVTVGELQDELQKLNRMIRNQRNEDYKNK